MAKKSTKRGPRRTALAVRDLAPAITVSPVSQVDVALFKMAVSDVTPLTPANRVYHQAAKPRPIPRQSLADERAVLKELLTRRIALEDRLEIGDEPHYLRPNLPTQLLRDLRRGRWVINNELDLHGATRDEARAVLADFLEHCRINDQRVVRIVHGRGLSSPGKIGVLKLLVRGWLAQRDEVLAYCQAKPFDGGEGALIVLLKAR